MAQTSRTNQKEYSTIIIVSLYGHTQDRKYLVKIELVFRLPNMPLPVSPISIKRDDNIQNFIFFFKNVSKKGPIPLYIFFSYVYCQTRQIFTWLLLGCNNPPLLRIVSSLMIGLNNSKSKFKRKRT
jgi:hypothetical protein